MSEPLCFDCPDHEACMTGYPCEMVRHFNADLLQPATRDLPETSED